MTAVSALEPVYGYGALLNAIQLVEFTRFVADEVRSGRYPFVEFDEQARWHRRIYRDQRVDVWLISWLPDQGTQLHDHGGSSGSFTVISGVLAESVYVRSGRAAGTLREREHRAGEHAGAEGKLRVGHEHGWRWLWSERTEKRSPAVNRSVKGCVGNFISRPPWRVVPSYV